MVFGNAVDMPKSATSVYIPKNQEERVFIDQLGAIYYR